MANEQYLTTPVESEKMPGGIPYIVGNEAAERFSFYGMKAILFVFMTQFILNRSGVKDLMSDADATTYIHVFVAATYFCSIIGGFLSDAFFGKYQIIISLSIVYCLGHLVLAIDDTRFGLFWGLFLIVLGAGGIKPCVSAHVGDQFGTKNQHLLPRVFSWFYFSINFGAFLSTLLTPYFLNHPDYGAHVAFGVPGALMLLATIVFWLGRWKFIHVPARGLNTFIKSFTGEAGRSLARLCVIFIFLITFWSLFDQTASRWVEQAGKMDKKFNLSWLPFTSEPLSIEPTESQIQAANPALILILIPLFSYIIYPFLNRFFNLTALRKISIGFFVTAAAFALSSLIESDVLNASSQVTILAKNQDGETEKKQTVFLAPRTEDRFINEHDLGKMFTGIFAPSEKVTYKVDRKQNPSIFDWIQIDNKTGIIKTKYKTLDVSSQVTILATTEDGEEDQKQFEFYSPRTGDQLFDQKDLKDIFTGKFAPSEQVSYTIERNPNPSLFESLQIDNRSGTITAVFRSDAIGSLPHISWQLLAYVILTSAEIMVSITALEFAYTQAPNEAKSIVMSLYLLTVFFGNLLTAGVNYFIQNPDGTSKLEGADYYWFFTGLMFVTAVIFVGVAGKYKVRSYVQGAETANADVE